MQYYFLFFLSYLIFYVKAQSLVQDVDYQEKELRCLVCQKSIEELNDEISKIDPEKTVDVGGHRLDADGNYRHKSISADKSELHLSELMESVCGKMDRYVRALWKSNGTLTLFSMMDRNNILNGNFDLVDIIQDVDLNRSVGYYCETILGEFEEILIKMYQNETPDIEKQFCFKETAICPASGKKKEEL